MMPVQRRVGIILALGASFGARVWAADPAREAEVRKAQDWFAHCWQTRDESCMAPLLAPEFTWVFRTGKEVDRTAFLAMIMDGKDIGSTFFSSKDAAVHFYGPIALLTFAENDPPPTILTLVWVHSDSEGWQLVRGQGTSVATR